jgi:hypothetical protein
MTQQHKGDANKPSPGEYVAAPHHDPKSGFKGKFVPVKSDKQKKASQAAFAKAMADPALTKAAGGVDY